MLSIRINQVKAIALLGFFSFISLFIPKKAWVICERGKDARDNGYHFYKYLKNAHPEIKVYYIIDQSSPDYEKVEEDAVQYGSIRNYWVVATSKKLISTHYALCLPDIGSKLFALCGLGNKFYFLQHGIIKADLAFLFEANAPMRLFCCGAKPEFEYVKNVFGHPEGVVNYTGLARFDKLHDYTAKNAILVMPTWRQYLSGASAEEFKKSEYFIRWSEFLTDPRLSDMLRENGFKLYFYPHYELQKFIDCFTFEDENIILSNFRDFDVQQLLMDAKLLITDYSSVFFDIAYMKKPCVFYQFDKDAFFTRHYLKGHCDYSEHGFGDVVTSAEELLTSLGENFSRKFVPQDKYAKQMDSFFVLHDMHNCERIYNAIEAME